LKERGERPIKKGWRSAGVVDTITVPSAKRFRQKANLQGKIGKKKRGESWNFATPPGDAGDSYKKLNSFAEKKEGKEWKKREGF